MSSPCLKKLELRDAGISAPALPVYLIADA